MKNITKSELLPGDILLCNNGRYYVYCDTERGKRFVSCGGWLDILHYNEELKLIHPDFWRGYFDFNTVYRVKNGYKILYSADPCSYNERMSISYSLQYTETVFLLQKSFINLKNYV